MTTPTRPGDTSGHGRTARVACIALLAAAVQAQPVADPTRPAAALISEPATPRLVSAPSPKPAAAAPAPLPALQSVQIPRDGAPNALLGGQVVRVGDRIGEHLVTAIDGQGVSLRGPRGEQRLALFANVTKSASREGGTPRAALAPDSVTRSQDTP